MKITIGDGPGNMPLGRMMQEQADAERLYGGTVHWLPRPVNESPLTACSLDLNEHPKVRFSRSLNEVTCLNCLHTSKSFLEEDKDQ